MQSVPIAFAKRHGLNKSQEIVLMNEEGRSWPSKLSNESSRFRIGRVWTSFCTENKLEVGYSCKFRLLQNTEKPVFQLCSRTNVKAEEDLCDITEENRFVTLTPTPNSLKLGKQALPVIFTRLNGLSKPGKIVLVDKDNVECPMELKVDKISGVMYILSGCSWKSFCETNGVSVGDSLTLELVRRDTTSLLKFCSKVQAQKQTRVQKRSHEDLQHKQPCSVSEHENKVKQSVVDALASIKRFRLELETMEQKLEDTLNEIKNVGEEKTKEIKQQP